MRAFFYWFKNTFTSFFSASQSIRKLFIWIGIGIVALGVFNFYSHPRSTYLVDLPELGEPIAFYSNQVGDDLDRVLYQAISKAKKSIYIEIFNLNDQSIIKLLNTKSSEKIDVQVIVDNKYYQGLRSQLKEKVSVSRGKTRGGLMHRKVIVIDEEQSWLGSANFTWESLKNDYNLIAGVHSQELAKLLLDPNYPSHGTTSVANQTIELWNIPESSVPVQQLLVAIDSAKEKIKIAMFTWTRKDLADAVIKAHQRGVQVFVVLDKNSVEGASESIYKYLKQNKIAVKISSLNSTMHHKMLWIDDQSLYFGSVNWTAGGFSRNRDVLVNLSKLNQEQERFMNKLWQQVWVHAKTNS
jgi:phosphatidylserine/phosphatidylglycerophosphate/cardiolipin synthase-like enzyme